MFVRPLACAVLLVARVAAQESVPTAPTAPAEEPFMTIQTFLPTSISETEGESTSACLEVCVVEPCTQCVHSRQPSQRRC